SAVTSGSVYYTGGNIGIGVQEPKGQLSLGADLDNKGIENHSRIILGNNENYGIGLGQITEEEDDDDLYIWVYKGTEDKDIRFMSTSNGAGSPDTSAWQTNMIVKGQTGNIGIGVLNPSQRLEAAGTIKAENFEGDGSNITNVTAETMEAKGLTGAIQAHSSLTENKLYIDGTGNIGIGTQSPKGKLGIQGSFATPLYYEHGRIILNNDEDYGIGAGMIDEADDLDLYIWSGQDSIGENKDIRFMSTSNGLSNPSTWQTNMIIKGKSGYIGIGTTEPQYQLDVNGSIHLKTGGIYFADGTSMLSAGTGSATTLTNNLDAVITADADGNTSGEIQFNISGTEKMVILNNGRVGIGTETPTEELEVNGTIKINALTIGTTNISENEVSVIDNVTAGTAGAGKALVLDSNKKINELDITSLKLNGTQITSTADELNILDGVTAGANELNTLDGITAAVNELNILDGVTANTGELNVLSGVTAGTSSANKAVVLDMFKKINELDITTLKLNGSAVTASAGELNKLDGVTASSAELNILDGVTADSSEINVLDGITAATNELNVLDGVTSTTAELNILDGVTANAGELNVLSGVTAGTAAANKAVVLDLFKKINELDITTLKLNGSAVTASAGELNKLDGVTASSAELNILDGVTASSGEINKLDGYTGGTADLNYLKDLYNTGVTSAEFDRLSGVTSNIQTQIDDANTPDYDSGWFSATNDVTYVKNHGLNGAPMRVEVYVKGNLDNGQPVGGNPVITRANRDGSNNYGTYFHFNNVAIYVRARYFAAKGIRTDGFSDTIGDFFDFYYRILAWL
ncbi:hypothetical protein ACFL4O_03635, partial [bacterium]